MTDELMVCAAAFFRTMGKDVTTPEEFVMNTSLELKWMSPSDSKLLLATLIGKGILSEKGGFIRPAADIGGMDIPLAYKPSAEVIATIHEKNVQKPAKTEGDANDPFPTLMAKAVESGMERRDFIQSCNKIQKRLNIDIGAAALIVLRDGGVDIAPYVEMVYGSIRVS